MATIDQTLVSLLSTLKNVREYQPGKWRASCPTDFHEHGDRSAGLHIEIPNGKLLVNCPAGCGFSSICSAVGLKMGDFFPDDPTENRKPIKIVYPPGEILAMIDQELQTIALGCEQFRRGTITLENFDLMTARMDRVLEIVRARR